MRVLITGGAGFVGSNLARLFRAESPANEVVVLDNLKRRGSEINLPRFAAEGIRFMHGDIRQASDLADLDGSFDLMIEASAEPSVLAGLNQSPAYLLQTNLSGTLNCLEFARARAGAMLFLSTSRVYSIEPLKAIALHKAETRFEIESTQNLPGVSPQGIAESFPTDQARSLYGASKLASELMIQEYCDTYGMKAVINRCGVICGPGQFGKVDQGVFALWLIHHHYRKPLQYTGFGGTGLQVRDLLHPADLFTLLQAQISRLEKISGRVYNVGGGPRNAISLREMTALCQQLTGNRIEIQPRLDTARVDIPLYVSDNRRAEKEFDWRPRRDVSAILREVHEWLLSNETALRPLYGVAA